VTESGRVSLFNLVGTTVRDDLVETWHIGSSVDLARRLADEFDLGAAAQYADAIWRRIAWKNILAAE
jgi:hypothetical protein